LKLPVEGAMPPPRNNHFSSALAAEEVVQAGGPSHKRGAADFNRVVVLENVLVIY
jgi:hypothetical protein